jgi:hypothetical protein
MDRLAVLSEPRTFPPRKFLIFVWGVTLALALYGLIVSVGHGGVIAVWLTIGAIAVWQIWVLRWVQVDVDGIRHRNVFGRGRELKWDEIREYREEEVRLSKHPYVVLHLSNRSAPDERGATRMKLTNDQVGFETLRTIVREAVPKEDPQTRSADPPP